MTNSLCSLKITYSRGQLPGEIFSLSKARPVKRRRCNANACLSPFSLIDMKSVSIAKAQTRFQPRIRRDCDAPGARWELREERSTAGTGSKTHLEIRTAHARPRVIDMALRTAIFSVFFFLPYKRGRSQYAPGRTRRRFVYSADGVNTRSPTESRA